MVWLTSPQTLLWAVGGECPQKHQQNVKVSARNSSTSGCFLRPHRIPPASQRVHSSVIVILITLTIPSGIVKFSLQPFKGPASCMSDSAFLGSTSTLVPEKAPGPPCMADGAQTLTLVDRVAKHNNPQDGQPSYTVLLSVVLQCSRFSIIVVKDPLPTAVLHPFNPQKPLL